MSAQIPETMPLSDLLKSTGYDCPEELMGKTFAEATSGGDTKISTNTDKTVDVSAYTEPIEIEPAEGYDATKKVTLTLDNIPSGADIEANKAATIDVSTYTEPVEITPTEGKDGMAKATVTLTNVPSGGAELTLDYPSWLTEGSEMSSVVPNGVKVSITDYDHTPSTYIIAGDGTKTIAELTGQSSFNGFFGAYGQSVVIEVQ